MCTGTFHLQAGVGAIVIEATYSVKAMVTVHYVFKEIWKGKTISPEQSN